MAYSVPPHMIMGTLSPFDSLRDFLWHTGYIPVPPVLKESTIVYGKCYKTGAVKEQALAVWEYIAWCM